MPTPEMLAAVTHTSFGDGVSRSDITTNSLEEYMASMTLHEAAVFVLSGTMGNLLGIRSLLMQPPHAILCDARSHFLAMEASGTFLFTGALSQPVEPSNGLYLTLEDILPHVKIRSKDTPPGVTPTRLIVLENTLRGMVMPFSEAKRISEYARKNGIKIHLDGARLWEAVVASVEPSSDYRLFLGEYCSLFDTVTMCFSKGLGAPIGAILVGSEVVINQARWLRQSIGGSVRQPGILTSCAFTAVKNTFEGGLLKRTHDLAREIATFWENECQGKLRYPTQTNMVWLDCTGQTFSLEDLRREAEERGVFIKGERLVVHYRKWFSVFLSLLFCYFFASTISRCKTSSLFPDFHGFHTLS